MLHHLVSTTLHAVTQNITTERNLRLYLREIVSTVPTLKIDGDALTVDEQLKEHVLSSFKLIKNLDQYFNSPNKVDDQDETSVQAVVSDALQTIGMMREKIESTQ